jgi:hypothetical protein
MSKRKKIQQAKALNSDPIAQRIAELKRESRKSPVRPSQKHTNKRKCAKHRRRQGVEE